MFRDPRLATRDSGTLPGMSPEEFRQNRPCALRFASFTRELTRAAYVLGGLGFAGAAYAGWQGAYLNALLIAVAAFLFLRSHARLVLWLARRRFANYLEAGPVLVLLNRDLGRHGPRAVLGNLAALARKDRGGR